MPNFGLLEAAKTALNNGETRAAAIIMQFARSSAWLANIPFRNIPGNAYAYNQEGDLPGVAFRGINESYTASTGVLNPQVETLRIGGGLLTVDRALLAMFGEQNRTVQEMMKVKALAAGVTSKIIKGDSTTDRRESDGLQFRVTGTQHAPNSTADGGAALSLYKLDTGISLCSGPNKQIWLSKAMKLRLTQAARTTGVSGYITYGQDAFGRVLEFYNGIPLVEAYPENDGTEPLPFTETTSGGATATATSIYIVSLAPGYMSGLQNGDMRVIDVGASDSGTLLSTLVEWYVSPVMIEHGKSVVRVSGITDAAVVA